ncbi:hypothetical protein IEO21_05401 [Rhodonia placenta]|uniref:Uncharacterized protein n=1 Tax=Rhodonia placenta TaxID=104341 RepID=A0A8H7P1Y5_9APHY|nr:hypothetical protein IEO21_05401 [Postia placenta]
MRFIQSLLLPLTLLATTVLADDYARDTLDLEARSVWDDDALFARSDDELYARDFEEHKDHPLVRELINVLAARAGNCYNNNQRITVPIGRCNPANSVGMLAGHQCANRGAKYYFCMDRAGGACMPAKKSIGLEHGESAMYTSPAAAVVLPRSVAIEQQDFGWEISVGAMNILCNVAFGDLKPAGCQNARRDEKSGACGHLRTEIHDIVI